MSVHRGRPLGRPRCRSFSLRVLCGKLAQNPLLRSIGGRDGNAGDALCEEWEVHIAYQVFGSGPNDLVFVPGFISHVENYWDHADLARWLLRLAAFARVIMFDKRGTGLSDPVAQAPALELRMDDVRAVMDAAGSESATVAGRVGRWRSGRPVSPQLTPSAVRDWFSMAPLPASR